MIRPRMSVQTLCGAIALVAVDCAMLRAAHLGNEWVEWVNVIALPMMNILVFAFCRQQELRSRGETRPGWIGFQLAGWAGVVAALALLIGIPETLVALVNVFDPVRDFWFNTPSYLAAAPQSPAQIRIWWIAELSLLITLSAALTASLLLIALAGRWAASRFSKGETKV